ncbi:MAG TPA: TraR/DksA C4-type zinc finger protein [candidate division Zixibacteria bacterium]|nr:TraR/DksA family transcriptional regulator [candidate division Zixibacteria bacterium]MDD4917316.1 TraR/DksA C4-type zinc finger protein [candidate division Zixibacteria bacterium]MDM7971536.1 TraR/DksA C4-type zinc finger protein [candidate division Zixibacteria bacterium]HOD65470.1 TraR/DksA C4-type zinc finger protein [candidate division Zixibacteria bacterium]HPM36754.1 TraR/DksA C4-type zinc finger protein [candidate division Zixibacteria bacterium]
MKKTEKEKLRKLLLAKRKKLVEEMKDTLESNFSTTMTDSDGDISSYSFHMADQATDAMEREMAFMQASKSGRFLYHLDEALRRLDSKDFGKCIKCGKDIGMARLEAVPHARLCIACKEAEEHGRRK